MAECGCVGADLQQMAWLAAYSRRALNLHLAHFKWLQSEISAFNTPRRRRRKVVLRLHTVCGLVLHAGGSGRRNSTLRPIWPRERDPMHHRGSESTFYAMLPHFRKSSAVLKVPRLRPLVLLIATYSLRWIWRVGGMTLTGKNLSTGWETCHGATLYTKNPTRTDLVLNPCLRGEKPTIKYWINTNCTYSVRTAQ